MPGFYLFFIRTLSRMMAPLLTSKKPVLLYKATHTLTDSQGWDMDIFSRVITVGPWRVKGLVMKGLGRGAGVDVGGDRGA